VTAVDVIAGATASLSRAVTATVRVVSPAEVTDTVAVSAVASASSAAETVTV
jgi:hypothetical protein